MSYCLCRSCCMFSTYYFIYLLTIYNSPLRPSYFSIYNSRWWLCTYFMWGNIWPLCYRKVGQVRWWRRQERQVKWKWRLLRQERQVKWIQSYWLYSGTHSSTNSMLTYNCSFGNPRTCPFQYHRNSTTFHSSNYWKFRDSWKVSGTRTGLRTMEGG